MKLVALLENLANNIHQDTLLQEVINHQPKVIKDALITKNISLLQKQFRNNEIIPNMTQVIQDWLKINVTFKNNNKASLVVVGSGIKFISHLTTEAKAYITQSDIVLYLVNDPAMKEWIELNNPNTESLDFLYNKYYLRSQTYETISEYILSILRKELQVCVVMYGHPTVFAQSSIATINQARKEGYNARALPGISSIDCLYADLMIDPGECGSQIFDATDFLCRSRKFDVNSHLILLQVGFLGVIHHDELLNKENHLLLLVNYLTNFYNRNHEIILYEAAPYPTFDPKIEKNSLENLSRVNISAITTLYIPPSGKSPINTSLLKSFDINPQDLK